MVHIMVADLDVALAQVRAAGGEVLTKTRPTASALGTLATRPAT